MKALKAKNIGGALQKGFTIIELVVVILLLGILAATAFPRFMDVTDEAHIAVVDAVEGGLSTGVGLFRAQWVGKGQPLGAAVADFGSSDVYPDDNTTASSGFPIGTGVAFTDPTDCLSIYNGILQAGGRPAATSAVWNSSATTLEANIEAAVGTNDFVAVSNTTAANQTGCVYYYVGQYTSGNSTITAVIPTISYTVATGAITQSTVTFDN